MMRKMIAAGGIALAALGATSCGTTRTVQVTKDVPGPAVTVTVPGPTITKTVIAQPPVLTAKTFSGSGDWNSSAFSLACGSGTPTVTVKYSYSGNELPGETTGDNFVAALQETGNGDEQQIANTIAASGGNSTTLYPNPQNNGDYYLSVQASGNWTFHLSETCQ